MFGEGNFTNIPEELNQMASETVKFIPKILIALVIILITVAIVKVINFLFRKLLEIAKIDKFFAKIAGVKIPFSITNLFIYLTDLGIILIALYSIVDVCAGPQYTRLMTNVLYYGAKVASVIIITLLIFASFNFIVQRLRAETRLRGYMLFIAMLLITAMLVDVTALSDQVKSALITGISIGVGISLGVFAIWFFFHEYLDKIITKKEEHKR
ncbi:hypothetical protein J7L49_02990 [Candidatus Bathyarchaeota archaeon]|nr:hypothetical protein [Candidatus Bathyarchaeota archaeon]